jgi:DNA-binding NarL/FixJ family response regulator
MCLFGKMKAKKEYAKALEMLEKNNISNIRKRIKILVVDDETDDIYQVLKERQYEVYYKNDMNYAVEAEPFEIVVMDIKGVAKRLQSNMEGFALACEVKHKYPLKRVCCYSGSIHKEISEKLTDNKIDAFFSKDMEMDKICDKIDKLILEYADYKQQWEILRKQLVEHNMSEEDIKKIQGAYEDGFKKGDILQLNNVIMETIKNGTMMLNITSSIITLIKVLVV